MILCRRTREEKEAWLECLFHTIKELYQRKSSLRVGRETLRPLDSEVQYISVILLSDAARNRLKGGA